MWKRALSTQWARACVGCKAGLNTVMKGKISPHQKRKRTLICYTKVNELSITVLEIMYPYLKSSDVIHWGLESPAGVAIDWIHDTIF